VVLASHKYAESEKSSLTFFDHALFKKTHFCEKKNVLFLVENCTLAKYSGMFRMICFGVDSQTHTLCVCVWMSVCEWVGVPL
jgi:hypothetical protein